MTENTELTNIGCVKVPLVHSLVGNGHSLRTKGGIVFAIKNEYDIPVKFVGLGEGIDDMEEFNPVEFVNAIIEPEGEKIND